MVRRADKPNTAIRVLVVDDSPLIRTMLVRELTSPGDIEVVGCAGDPYEARDLIVELQPDVVTLDLEMPRMNGAVFLRKLMRHHPVPVVVVSSFSPEGSDRALDALEAGAVDVIGKPGPDLSAADFHRRLTGAVRIAATASARGARRTVPARLTRQEAPLSKGLIVFGASIGGPQALQEILAAMPPWSPPILVAQHMPALFTGSFAARLDQVSGVRVSEARAGDRVEPGTALVAPGDQHLIVQRTATGLVVDVRSGPLVSSHRPSIDVLMKSAARAAGPAAVGVLMTGMGHDGVAGLQAMHLAGAATFVQDEATSVVFGMARLALDAGFTTETVPLSRIAERALALSASPAG